MRQATFNLDQSVAAKETGQDLVSSHNPTFLDTMRQVARDIAARQGSVTADDLRRYAAAHSITPHHPNAWGAIFRGAHWQSIGIRRSALVSNHARTIRGWSLRP